MKQPHILCAEEDVEKMVLLPGDPDRVLRVAGFLDSWEEIAYNREFRTIKGTYKGMPSNRYFYGYWWCFSNHCFLRS